MDTSAIVGDARFFLRTGPHTLAAVVEAAGAEAPPRRIMLSGIAPLEVATPNEISFLDNRKYVDALARTQAGAVLIKPALANRVPSTAITVLTPEPYAAWARVAALFHPLPPVNPGIHPTAIVAPDAEVDGSAEIAPYVVVGSRARIGRNCRIGAHAVVGEGVIMGMDCRIGPHVTLSHALIGDRVCVYPGARIGQDGFGFAITAEGYLSVPQLGRVILGHDVEVGANTTIDRGSAHDTVIGAGSRLDNLVQIGHNVQLGRACVIVAQSGISGSTSLGDQVMLGGQAGIAGHLKVGPGSRIGAQSGVMSDVAANVEVSGSPAQPVRQFFRELATLRRMARDETQARARARNPGKQDQSTD